jgi:hypothetical protein
MMSEMQAKETDKGAAPQNSAAVFFREFARNL